MNHRMHDTQRLSRRVMFPGAAALAFCLGSALLPAAETGGEATLDNPFFAMDTAVGGAAPNAQAEMLKELGYAGLSCSLNSDIPAVLKALDRRGLKLFAVYTGARLGAGGPRYDQKLPEVVRQLKGRDTIVWLTLAGNAPNGEEQAVEVVHEVADLAQAAGLRVALYPHAGFYMARVADAVRIAKKAERPNVGITFNLCHWLKEGQPEKMIEDIQGAAPHLFVVTINGADRDAKNWNRLIQTLDRGDFDVYPFLSALRRAGFRGPVGFQGYGIGGDARENLRRTMAAWQEFVTPSSDS